MFTRDGIISELEKRGVHAMAFDNRINSLCKREGIIFNKGTGISVANPTYYMDSVPGDLDDSSAADYLVRIDGEIGNRYSDSASLFSQNLINESFVQAHIFIGFCRGGFLKNMVMRPSPYKGIFMYLFVSEGDVSTRCSMDAPWLKSFDSEELWSMALYNTLLETQVMHMGEVLDEWVSAPMYIVTNRRRWRGAANILDRSTIARYMKAHDVNERSFFCIPSSIHEILLIPYSEDFTLEKISPIVRIVNSTHVPADEQLSDEPFIFSV